MLGHPLDWSYEPDRRRQREERRPGWLMTTHRPGNGMGEGVLAVTGAAGECWPVLATSVLEAVRQWHGEDKRAFRRARWQVQVGGEGEGGQTGPCDGDKAQSCSSWRVCAGRGESSEALRCVVLDEESMLLLLLLRPDRSTSPSQSRALEAWRRPSWTLRSRAPVGRTT